MSFVVLKVFMCSCICCVCVHACIPVLHRAVGRMRDRNNWQSTSLQQLCGVLHLVTALAVDRRDWTELDADGANAVFEGTALVCL